jgi:hypothetical protein
MMNNKNKRYGSRQVITPVEGWLYSSAGQYYTGQKGLLDIIQIEPKLITV